MDAEAERRRRLEMQRKRERVEAMNQGNEHPLNRRALELLKEAVSFKEVSHSMLYIHQLMFWRFYPNWPDSPPYLEAMRWGKYSYYWLEMKIFTMQLDWMADEQLKYLTQDVETGGPLVVFGQNEEFIPILDALNAAQTPEEGADILLRALSEQMENDPEEWF